MMKTSFRILASLFLATALLSSCQSVKKYVESGNYDSAIDLAVERLRGKKNKKTEIVHGLEVAFKKAQTRDLATIKQLMSENRGENWECIHDLHIDIRARQNKIAPLLPLVSSHGYRARFDFVDIGKMESESRNNAAGYLYDQAEMLIRKAETQGDKLAARKAYDKLADLGRRYYRDYKDKAKLMEQARELGTSYILIEVKNNSNKVLPAGLSDRLLALSKNELDTEWKQFYFDSRPGERFDYKAVFNIDNLDVSPERVNERTYFDEKDIQDGWEYELDKRGNVKKDSLGNDIKRAKYVTIRAQVLEIHQTKAARMSGYVEIFDLDRQTRLDTRNLATEIQFEHFAATFKGDERALTKESRQKIGSQPVPFPPDLEMLTQAADRLKPNLEDELKRNKAIL